MAEATLVAHTLVEHRRRAPAANGNRMRLRLACPACDLTADIIINPADLADDLADAFRRAHEQQGFMPEHRCEDWVQPDRRCAVCGDVPDDDDPYDWTDEGDDRDDD